MNDGGIAHGFIKAAGLLNVSKPTKYSVKKVALNSLSEASLSSEERVSLAKGSIGQTRPFFVPFFVAMTKKGRTVSVKSAIDFFDKLTLQCTGLLLA
jgi:hypothetical protein